jgi:co-chaperonin GroES (HSP10)
VVSESTIREVVSELRSSGGPSIGVSFSAPMTDDERTAMEESRREREAEAQARRQRALEENEKLPARPGNAPHPTMINAWGENMFIGRIILNEDAVTRGGILLPNLKLTQDKPHACTIISVSTQVDESKYPWLVRARESIASGEGSTTVLYKMNFGHEWTDLDGGEYVLLDARNVIGDYDPERVRKGTMEAA